EHRCPTIYGTCKKYGVDISQEPIPVVPAAHYMCGGVLTDKWGVSSVNNLLALGETACTGLHGANRLASNSLLEAVVFAHRAAQWVKKHWLEITHQESRPVQDWRTGRAQSIEENVLISHNWDQIRRLMWNYVGIVRSKKRLHLVERRMRPILIETKEHFCNYLLTPDLIELRNIVLMADLIIKSASLRRESRGLHYLLDYPERDDVLYGKDTILEKSKDA
ncbi:MAG: FAD-binding protein, partial [Candidatus Electrothrix sp. AR1]|nr:FAD-binding protein [Candidatus Electrothrix sp. AR1]